MYLINNIIIISTYLRIKTAMALLFPIVTNIIIKYYVMLKRLKRAFELEKL